jgi:hypothetical protein
MVSVEPPWISPRFSRLLSAARTTPSKSTPSCWKKRRSSTATVASLMFCGIAVEATGVRRTSAWMKPRRVHARGRADLQRLAGLQLGRRVGDADDPGDDAADAHERRGREHAEQHEDDSMRAAVTLAAPALALSTRHTG